MEADTTIITTIAEPIVGTGTNFETMKDEVRWLERRKAFRESRKKFRNRRRKNEESTQARIDELRLRICSLMSYQRLMTQIPLLYPARCVQFRGLLLDLYLEYFQFGSHREADPQSFERQTRYLAQNWDEQFQLMESPELGRGYKIVIDQWERYSLLHGHFCCVSKEPLEKVTRDGSIFRLKFVMELSITHKTVSVVYPHMLDCREFMEKAIGKSLRFNCVKMFYWGENNKVEAMTSEYNLHEGFTKLLKNPELVKKLFKQERKEGLYITVPTEDARAPVPVVVEEL